MELQSRPEVGRKPSRIDHLSNNLKLDLRAHQRTYEGAYTRTAITCLSFSILIIKLFSKEFLHIGLIYTVYGSIIFFLGVAKTSSVDIYYDPNKHQQYYNTAGNSVVLLFTISLVCYTSILALIIKL